MTPDPSRDRDPLAEARRLKRREVAAGDLLAAVVTAVAIVGALTLLAIGVVTT